MNQLNLSTFCKRQFNGCDNQACKDSSLFEDYWNDNNSWANLILFVILILELFIYLPLSWKLFLWSIFILLLLLIQPFTEDNKLLKQILSTLSESIHHESNYIDTSPICVEDIKENSNFKNISLLSYLEENPVYFFYLIILSIP